MKVKSKYGSGVYVGLFAVFTFLVMFIFIALKVYDPENKINSEEVPSIVLLIPVLAIAGTLYYTFKNAPAIIIDHQAVSIKKIWGKKKKIDGQDISQIDLFEMVAAHTTWDSVITRIHLLSGEKIKIADSFFKNIGDMKLALIENFPDKIKSFQTGKKNIPVKIQEHEPIKFSGNKFLNYHNLLFLLLILLLFFFPLRSNKENNIWAATIILPLFYLILGYRTHYFILDNDFFTIKNHYFPWVNKQYKIESIIAFNFEYAYRGTQGLRITTKDFRSRFYLAGSLREKHWKALQEKLEALGIYFIS